MSEVKDLPDNKKESKNPVDNAGNKIRESILKETQKRLDEKVKAAYDAIKILKTLKGEIRDLQKETVAEKLELDEFLKGLK